MAAREDLKKVIKRMNGLFRGRNKQTQKKLLKSMGLETIDIIVTRTRRGFGVKRTGGNRRKLKKLSPGYIKHRQRNRNLLSRFTSPGKSNLTFTGQMLESVKIIKANDSEFILGPSGRRSDGKRNADVGRWVTEQGRPFMNLGRKEITDLQKFVREEMQNRIKKL